MCNLETAEEQLRQVIIEKLAWHYSGTSETRQFPAVGSIDSINVKSA